MTGRASSILHRGLFFDLTDSFIHNLVEAKVTGASAYGSSSSSYFWYKANFFAPSTPFSAGRNSWDGIVIPLQRLLVPGSGHYGVRWMAAAGKDPRHQNGWQFAMNAHDRTHLVTKQGDDDERSTQHRELIHKNAFGLLLERNCQWYSCGG